MIAPTLLRPLAAIGLASVLALAPTAAAATGPSAPDPGATVTVEPAPADEGVVPSAEDATVVPDGAAEPTGVDPAGDSAGEAGQPGPFQPLAGRGGSWIAWPGGRMYREGSISASNPLQLQATFNLTSVVGGYAQLERTNGSLVGGRVDISGIRGEKTLRWALASEVPGEYRIRAVTGVGMGTTTYSNPFEIYEQLDQPRFLSQPQNREIALGQTAVISVNAAIDAIPATTVQVQVSSDGGLTWRNEGGPQGAVLASIVVTGSATNNGWKYRFVATRASSNAYILPASTTSDVATLTVIPAPVVTGHPLDVTAREGAFPSFNAAATGYDSVRWETRTSSTAAWSTVAGETRTTYAWTVGATMAQTGTQVRAVFTNASGSTATNPATVTVTPGSPTVTSHPQDRTVTEGQPAGFTVGYAGTGVSVRWETRASASGSWSTVAGATGTTYTVPSTTFAMSGSQYRAVFTNSGGTVWTNPATLTVNAAAPVITAHPGDRTVVEGGSVVFTAAATSSTDVTWQWQYQSFSTGWFWRTIVGATSDAYTVDAATLAMSRTQYRAVATSAAGSATTNSATLTVTPALPRVTGHPQSQRVPEGGSATFSATYAGTEAPVSWQWQSRAGASGTWADVPGATTSTYTVGGVTLLQSGQQYRAVLTDDAGSVQTDAATLTVDVVAPTVTGHPQDQAVLEGSPATFSAAYGGTQSAVSVQWYRMGSAGTWVAIEGATSLAYTVESATLSMNGDRFRAEFRNISGSVTTAAGMLRVDPVIPTVSEHPQSVSVLEGGSARFYAAYSGTEYPTVTTWQYSTDGGTTFEEVPPSVGAVGTGGLLIELVEMDMQGWQFRAGFSNAAGEAWSDAATLTVLRVQPINLTVVPRAVLVDSLPERG